MKNEGGVLMMQYFKKLIFVGVLCLGNLVMGSSWATESLSPADVVGQLYDLSIMKEVDSYCGSANTTLQYQQDKTTFTSYCRSVYPGSGVKTEKTPVVSSHLISCFKEKPNLSFTVCSALDAIQLPSQNPTEIPGQSIPSSSNIY